MCLIIHKPAGVTVPLDIIESAIDYNPDGVGIMLGGGAERFLKIAPNKLARRLDRFTDRDMAIHFRWATHGAVRPDNVHPFKLRNGGWMMHNGVLSRYTPKEGKDAAVSDTREFIAKFVNPMLETLGTLDVSAVARETYGNALAIMGPDGEIIRTGTSWVIYKGLHLSNTYAWDAPKELSWNYGREVFGWRYGSAYDGEDDGDLRTGRLASRTSYGSTSTYGACGTAGASLSREGQITDSLLFDIMQGQDFIDWSSRELRSLSMTDLAGLASGELDLAEFVETCSAEELICLYRAATL